MVKLACQGRAGILIQWRSQARGSDEVWRTQDFDPRLLALSSDVSQVGGEQLYKAVALTAF